jgi:phosphonate transport system substrate-binding protein
MWFTSRAVTILVSLVVSLLPFASRAADKQTVRLGLTEKKATLQSSFGGILDHLKSSSSIEFVVTAYDDYDQLYAAFKEKKIDLALVGAVRYVEARSETGAIPVIAEGGMARSVIVVRTDSPIKDVKSLAGKTFAMGYEGSTSTHLMPLLLLSKHRVKESDLNRIDFIGADHEKIVNQVLSGKSDAGAVVETVYERHKDTLRALETSDPFPGSPLMARKDADPAMIEEVRKVFLSYRPVPGQRFHSGAIAVTNTDYNQIRFLCKVVLGKTYL